MNAKIAFNYKVKVQKPVTLLLAGALCLAFSSCASSSKNKDNIMDEPLSDTVSYTHLDVYKRHIKNIWRRNIIIPA